MHPINEEIWMKDRPNNGVSRRIWKNIPLTMFILIGLMIISGGLYFSHLSDIGNSNEYYTAAVKSMLHSWSNFFFVAAEPGGSVTVDKPPLGLWVETAFAAVFGVSGVVTVLPNILSGIFSIPLLYCLVKKYFGEWGGISAAAVLTAMPVVYAVNRNNTIDGMLVFTLLLAAWAFIKATESGRLRYLLLGSGLVGLGFNIKSLEAFLPLPAFFALYILGAKAGWRKKLLSMTAAVGVLMIVSLAWVIAVDLTPTEQRPYVGSSSSNSEIDLLLGYNGINRLVGRVGADASSPQNSQMGNIPEPLPASPNRPSGQRPPPERSMNAAGMPPGGGTIAETGEKGFLRLFIPPLAKETSWFLPIALSGLIWMAIQGKITYPLSQNHHKGWILWGGWFLTCVIFFSVAGFFHAYYTIMMAIPAAAVAGGGLASAWNKIGKSKGLSILFLMTIFLTMVYQEILASQLIYARWWFYLPPVYLVIGLLLWLCQHFSFSPSGKIVLLLGICVIPFIWSVLTVINPVSSKLPAAYSGKNSSEMDRDFNPIGDPAVLEYLLANTQGIRYLVAVPHAMMGADLVLATGRPVLYMGGFSGSDPVVDATDLERMVANGDLRYIILEERGRNNLNVENWVQSNCSLLSGILFEHSGSLPISLYQCGK